MPTTRYPVAQLVRGYRDQIARDPELFDGDQDVAMWLINDTPGRDWSPSELGRAVGIRADVARRLLDELADDGHIGRDARGAWTRYYSRRA